MRRLLTDRSISRIGSLTADRAVGMPAKPGTYALLLRCAVERSIGIGRLGTLATRKGWYLYVGSAFGPGGIRARVNHHLRRSRHPRWHLDYLRPAVALTGIWYTIDPQRQEHQWAARLLQVQGGTAPLPGFGSSDCRCVTHLLFYRKLPLLPALS